MESHQMEQLFRTHREAEARRDPAGDGGSRRCAAGMLRRLPDARLTGSGAQNAAHGNLVIPRQGTPADRLAWSAGYLPGLTPGSTALLERAL